ncbi:transcriptional repressor [Mycobacterium phage Bromden]|uniref:Cro protein n=1 Tax=Mycobacterium phage Bromden TaxID=2283252 RepID=A0A345MBH5_9CAUD|nr:transcriptional repressor [Mycobacterium phage Bromden]AXH67846.1 Cro protein [Mycobacterium phage Bromden]
MCMFHLVPITTSPNASYKIEWIPEAVENLLHNHDILNRTELAKKINLSRSTVYEAFAEDWSGRASMKVLEAMCGHFRVPLSRIVTEPGRASAQARVRRSSVRKSV